MGKFSKNSLDRLYTCHPDLQILFQEVVKHYDCSILEGVRGQEDQDEAFYSGKSKVKWPNSKHNQVPSLAVDVAPWPIDWGDLNRFYHFAGFVMGLALQLGVKVRWGGDWDGDLDFKDQNFNDLVHWELMMGEDNGAKSGG